jgi:alpha-1,4-glucan:alpha-1,4-glucan 6-glycosyltransferase/4-alpha-glucanotransferase
VTSEPRAAPDLPALAPELRALADAYGVERAYHDIDGRLVPADAEALVAVLRSLGAEVTGAHDAGRALRARNAQRFSRLLPPVVVAWDGALAPTPFLVPRGAQQVVVHLELGDGRTSEWRWFVDDLAATPGYGRGRRVVDLPFDATLPPGYHRLTVTAASRRDTATVIAAPRRGADSRQPLGEREWSVFVPVAGLRSERNLGAGDLTDLDRVASFAVGQGAAAVATLPLLAAFLDDPVEASPYMPVSRRAWNELFVDVERAPELARAPDARRMLADPELARAVAAARAAPEVPPGVVARLKRPVLERMAAVVQGQPAREADLRRFLADSPLVARYAAFRAAGERFGRDWRRWPAGARAGVIRWTDVDPAADRYHRYAQFLVAEQLTALATRLRSRGRTLALDLPVGAHPDGFDVWSSPRSFMLDTSYGAPPDAFFRSGQSWGFPPPHPVETRLDGHELFRESVAHHLRVASLLRVDHVMGLHRVFVVPDGFEPARGCYVRMPSDELFAVLCLEAYRHGATIVGENLGTVPREVDDAMAEHGVRGMSLVMFAVDNAAAGEPLPQPAPGTFASWGSHDLPTFAGYWAATDLDERARLGQMEPGEEREARAARARGREALARLSGVPVEDAAQPQASLRAVVEHMASSPAAMVTLDLADAWLESEAVNLPGTTAEQRPNWRGRVRVPVEHLGDEPGVRTLAGILQRHRPAEPAGAEPPSRAPRTRFDATLLSDLDVHLFNEGRHFDLDRRLGAHPRTVGAQDGVVFGVWAPDAVAVSVIGDVNGWDPDIHPLRPVGESGLWEGFVPGAAPGQCYKFRIRSRFGGRELDKADPLAFATEVPPRTASVVWNLDGFEWSDSEWLAARAARQGHGAPVSIYEVHLGSWRRNPEEGNRSLTYRELAGELPEYVARLGFTHVELMPVMEHPFYGSWGYQVTGFFAPTRRYGTPQDFMHLVDALHRAGIGVVLDWVPSHFPADAHGLGFFDGTHLYEHDDARQRVHPEWDSWLFNYGRKEVVSFLVSNARFWLERYHADALRVDAVASMLYLDYGRGPGEWIPNRHGGKENLEAIELLQVANRELYRRFPDTMTIAEESTSWPGVTHPVHAGGLGFGFKWDMGWMHDTLRYLQRDPIHRRHHHHELTFRQVYAQSENFVLPLSHDEVVHGKGSLLGRMPGDDWQRFANLRLLLGYMWSMPGKKLLFMGGELAQPGEWHHEHSLDWHLLADDRHAGVQRWVAHLNRCYRDVPALHLGDCEPWGFEWVEPNDAAQSVLSYLRFGHHGDPPVLVTANFTPVPRPGYRFGVPRPGRWRLLAHGDAAEFGGSSYPATAIAEAEPVAAHGRSWSVLLDVPPLAAAYWVHELAT